MRLLGALDILQPWQFDPQHVSVEEEDRVQSLVLGGRRHVALAGEVTEEGGELLPTHVARMALAVKEDEPADPLDIRLLGTNAVVANAYELADLIQEPRSIGCPLSFHNPSVG